MSAAAKGMAQMAHLASVRARKVVQKMACLQGFVGTVASPWLNAFHGAGRPGPVIQPIAVESEEDDTGQWYRSVGVGSPQPPDSGLFLGEAGVGRRWGRALFGALVGPAYHDTWVGCRPRRLLPEELERWLAFFRLGAASRPSVSEEAGHVRAQGREGALQGDQGSGRERRSGRWASTTRTFACPPTAWPD